MNTTYSWLWCLDGHWRWRALCACDVMGVARRRFAPLAGAVP
jgi:hypothetical protein